VVEPVLDPVDDGPVGEERREAAPTRGHDRVGAPHPEVGLLLPGEARIRQVLSGRARADGDARIRPGFLCEGVVGLADLPLEAGRQGASRMSPRTAAAALASPATSSPETPSRSAAMRARRPDSSRSAV
jgi:hypothetical protein